MSRCDARARRLAALVAIAIGTFQWLVFRPGILTSDTVFQYREAAIGQFSNVHPPLMALVFAAWRSAGIGIGTLMWLQAVALNFGVLVLALTVLRRCVGDSSQRLTGQMFGAGLLVLSPLLSPCLFYGATFWKDVWLAIALLFLAVAYLRLVDPGRTKRFRTFGLLLAMVAVVPSLRHNAVVVVPCLGWLVWHGAPFRGWRARMAVTVLTLSLALVLPQGIMRCCGARDADPVGQVLALDLVGLWKAHPECRASLPHVQANVHPDLVHARYRFGHVAQLLWSEPVIVKAGMFESEPLHAEWWRAWKEFPLQMAEMKLRAFWPALGLGERLTHYWFEHGEWCEDLGLRHEGWSDARRALLGFGDYWVRHQKKLRWIGRVHGVWLVLAACLWMVALYCRVSTAGFGGLAFLALAYYGGFVLASVMPDYRFMFPATLLMQVVLIGGAFGALARLRGGVKE